MTRIDLTGTGRSGYRHHVSLTLGRVERAVQEAVGRYVRYQLTEW